MASSESPDLLLSAGSAPASRPCDSPTPGAAPSLPSAAPSILTCRSCTPDSPPSHPRSDSSPHTRLSLPSHRPVALLLPRGAVACRSTFAASATPSRPSPPASATLVRADTPDQSAHTRRQPSTRPVFPLPSPPNAPNRYPPSCRRTRLYLVN